MIRAAAFFAVIAAAPVGAADLTAEETAFLPRIFSSVSVEISDQHIGQEVAVLLRNAAPDASTADLMIIAVAPDERVGQPIVVVRNMVFAGTMAGQLPWLEVSDKGSLLIHSEQSGIGRSPWQETLTAVERDGEIRAAGYTLSRWDRHTAGTAVCDWNLLTGNWTLQVDIPPENGPDKTRSDSGRVDLNISLADWAPEVVPEFCFADLTEQGG